VRSKNKLNESILEAMPAWFTQLLLANERILRREDAFMNGGCCSAKAQFEFE
jgi:hypothetical protein